MGNDNSFSPQLALSVRAGTLFGHCVLHVYTPNKYFKLKTEKLPMWSVPMIYFFFFYKPFLIHCSHDVMVEAIFFLVLIITIA